MKKYLITAVSLFLLCAMVFSITGCELFQQEEPAPDITLKQVLGTWTREVERTTGSYTETYTFTDNMKFTKVGQTGPSQGTFSIEGNTLTLKTTMAKNPTEHIVRFYDDDNTMKWGSGSVTAEFTRVGKKKK